jgi:hypothetical protein
MKRVELIRIEGISRDRDLRELEGRLEREGDLWKRREERWSQKEIRRRPGLLLSISNGNL